MFDFGNVIFQTELLSAELILLYACPRRRLFWLRLLCSIAAAIVLSGFFPVTTAFSRTLGYSLLRFLFLFALSCAVVAVCFRLRPGVLLAQCAMGYAVQHCVYHLFMLFCKLPLGYAFAQALQTYSRYFELLFFAAAYVIVLCTLGRHVARQKYYKHYNKFLNIISSLVVIVCILLSTLSRRESTGYGFTLTASLYSIVCCSLAVFIQYYICNTIRIKEEAAAIVQIDKAEKLRYDSVKSIFEAVGINYHDLKHKIYTMDDKLIADEVQAIKDRLRVVDRLTVTGNEIFDVILTEKTVQYSAQQLSFSFNGNAAFLDFIEEADLASLIGNAVSNAAAAAATVPEPEKRKVSITLEKSGSMVTLVFQNYYAAPLQYRRGEIVSSKEVGSPHGLGLKSMRQTAQKYGGDIHLSADGEIFTIGIYLLHP